MFNYKMTISYDGTDFSGFQYQTNLRTVQGVLEENIFRVTNEKVTIVGSGRTDAGVHAKGQVVNFFLERQFEKEKIMRSLNSVLPIDLKVLKIEIVDDKFSARFSAKQKTYSYTIVNGTILSPFLARYATFVRTPLNVIKMKDGASHMIGTHNFKSFCKAKAEVKDYIKTVYSIEIEEYPLDIYGNVINRPIILTNFDNVLTKQNALNDVNAKDSILKSNKYNEFNNLENNFEELYLPSKIIKIYVTGKSFVHNMVRIMATAIINCGNGKFVPEDIDEILQEEKRTERVITAPAQGLCLEKVEY